MLQSTEKSINEVLSSEPDFSLKKKKDILSDPKSSREILLHASTNKTTLTTVRHARTQARANIL